ncbi:dehydrogenase, partial [Streptomyces sp. NPDC056689]
MRIGLIGTGRIGTFHAAVLERYREVGSLVVTDADPERAVALADRIGATAAPT